MILRGSSKSLCHSNWVFLLSLDRPWAPESPKARFPSIPKQKVAHVLRLFICFYWFLHSYCLSGCTTNCTDVDEAPNKNGGEIDEAPTGNSPKPPPEGGSTVAERPKASRCMLDVHVSHALEMLLNCWCSTVIWHGEIWKSGILENQDAINRQDVRQQILEIGLIRSV